MSENRTFGIGGREITLETGTIARQAHGSVVARAGGTVVLATVVLGPEPERPAGFLPLTVEYREKLAAAGRIPGTYNRREGRISDREVLASRLIDRSLRPLFPDGLRREVQVQATVFSAEPEEFEAPMLALLGAAAAVHISPVPWNGPVAGLRAAEIGGRTVLLPVPKLRAAADADLVVSAGRGGLVMIEGGGREVPEKRLLALLAEARAALAPALDALDALRAAAGVPKSELVPPAADPALAAAVAASAGDEVRRALGIPDKAGRRRSLAEAAARAVAAHAGGDRARAVAVQAVLDDLAAAAVRERILAGGPRLDGRGPADIRPIAIQPGWLPRPHGSAVFTRGQTQAVVTCTLAPPSQAQEIETLAGRETERFLLHYAFPGYSVGEARPLRGPGRREIGHGALARRALEPVLPPLDAFPYTIRLDSEITESNGSSSMATVCGGCLALMDAGVPIEAPVAGIAMGLISGDGRHAVLSDILGDEDHLGDMDFKVAGTRRGITAVQLDNKLGVLPEVVFAAALEQAREGRNRILDRMAEALPGPRPEVSERAPRGFTQRVAPDAVGALIGPRGATIKHLQASFGVEISVEDEGLVTVFAPDAAAAARVRSRIRDLAGIVQVGRLYRGRVTGVKEFGAFVRIYETAEGLVHVSDWDATRVDSMAGAAREGDAVVVRVLGVDAKGKLRLSRREALGAGDPIENM